MEVAYGLSIGTKIGDLDWPSTAHGRHYTLIHINPQPSELTASNSLKIDLAPCHWQKCSPLCSFYPNVTTLRSGLCCRNSVCLSVVCRLSVCRLSVTFVHPTQGVEPFGKISSPLCTLAILWPPCKILQGNSFVGGVKRKRGIKIERFRTYRRLYLTNGTR